MRSRILLASLAVVLAWGCTDRSLVAPGNDGLPMPPSPLFAISDAAHGSTLKGFYFLPPLVKSPTIVGSNVPGLQPWMEVCQLDGNPSEFGGNPNWAGVECVPSESAVVTRFAPGSASDNTDTYSISWDTDNSPANLSAMNPDLYYRIRIFLFDVELGYLDINPQVPSGQSPGDDYPDLYAFRLGETLPVKFVITDAAPCATSENYVIQCTASAVIDQDGGTITLEPDQTGWSKLSVFFYPEVLPEGYDQVTVTIERIRPDLFFAETGQHCIPGLGGGSFDAPLFDHCLRVTTDPVLNAPLSNYGSQLGALVELCVNPNDFETLKFGEEQDTRLQIIAFHDDKGTVEGLINADATTCGTPALPSPSQLGLLPVPEKGLLRYAAIGVNSVARMLGPAPLTAHGDIRLAGATSEFSRFMWGLPGQMESIEASDTIIQPLANEGFDLTVSVKVVDSGTNPDGGDLTPSAIEGATVHFSGPGTLSAADVVTGADGIATVTWTVPEEAGDYTLDATALGLLAIPVPDHGESVPFEQATIQFTATVAGAPSDVVLGGTLPADGDTVRSEYDDIGATVTDSRDIVVEGANIVWTVTSPGCTTGNEDVCGTVVDNGDGTVTWTLGSLAGTNTLTGTVAGTDPPVVITHTVVTAPAPAYKVVKGAGDGQSGPVSTALPNKLIATVTDQFGNPTSQDKILWTTSPSGSVAKGTWPPDYTYTWTLGPTPNTQYTATAYLNAGDPADRKAIFTATSICNVNVDGVMNADEWACATSEHFVANVSGGNADAWVYWQNYGGNLYLALKVMQADPSKANSVRFDFASGKGNETTHSENDDAVGININKGQASFYDQYLTLKCANSSQAGCGALDKIQNGAGNFDPSKTGYITYELVHPLTGGGLQDIDVKSGDLLGFFISLQSGNGAQGNTQWPGFRNFKFITIK